MHEFAIGERIVDVVLAELARLDPGSKLVRTRVIVGALHQLVPEYLVTAYDLLTRDTPAAGSAIDVVVEPVVGLCRVCQWQGPIELPRFQCARCPSFDVETVKGEELYVQHLEVETDDSA